jgi:hypothetical protein
MKNLNELRRNELISQQLITVSIFFLAVGLLAGVTNFFIIEDWATRGQAGDFFGGHLGSFANLGAFVLLLATTFIQKSELALQRSELELSRQANETLAFEAKEQSKIAQHQLQISRREYYDHFFSNLLEQSRQIEKNISFGGTYGSRALSTLSSKLKFYPNVDTSEVNWNDMTQHLTCIYEILKFIDTKPEWQENHLLLLRVYYPANYFDSLTSIISNSGNHGIPEGLIEFEEIEKLAKILKLNQ